MNLFGSKNTISIDFGADEINIVEGKYSKKGIVINNSFSIPVPKGLYVDGEIQDMEQLSYILRKGLSDNKVSQGNVYGVVNSTNIIIREITIPKVEESQIEAIISYQLDDYLPVSPENYVVKYIPLETITEEGIEKQNIMLVGIPNYIVESHLYLLKNVGLKPVVLDYAGNAITKLIHLNDKINDSYDTNSTVACVDLENDSTGLTISHQGLIRISRVVKVDIDLIEQDSGLNDSISSIKSNLNEILERIDMIFRYYRTREASNDIGLIVLYGGLSDIKGLEELIANFFEIPCIRLTTLNKIKFNGILSKYANAIGALIRIDGVK